MGATLPGCIHISRLDPAVTLEPWCGPSACAYKNFMFIVRIASRLAPLVLLAGAASTQAQDFSLQGFADVRIVAAPDEASWSRGGLGKTRYGEGETTASFAAAALTARWQATPALLLVADARYQPHAGAALSVTEAFARYRPVSTDAWRWSFKAGEFFAPISLENDGIGWTSPWTLSSSAIDTWVGEELRTFGGELRVEHRGDADTLEAAVALFGANDPAGEILSARGWALGDVVSGVGSHLREPDTYADLLGVPPPRRYDPFIEIDHRVGFYANVDWHSAQYGRVSATYYDNRADPSDYHTFNGDDELFAWRTKFSSLGAQTDIASLTVIAQAMSGSTEIFPPGFRSETHFAAAYVLAGWTLGAWRPALRFDAFTTRTDAPFPSQLDEHGNAWTFALNWRPLDWLRLTGEALRVDSVRDQRIAVGLAPRQIDTQIQFNARVFF